MEKRKKSPGEDSKSNIAARRMAFISPSDEVVTIPYKELVQKLVEKTNASEKEIKLLLQNLKKECRKAIAAGYMIKVPGGYFLPEDDHRTEKKKMGRKVRKVKSE
jgi:hypothetical protein